MHGGNGNRNIYFNSLSGTHVYVLFPTYAAARCGAPEGGGVRRQGTRDGQGGLEDWGMSVGLCYLAEIDFRLIPPGA